MAKQLAEIANRASTSVGFSITVTRTSDSLLTLVRVRPRFLAFKGDKAMNVAKDLVAKFGGPAELARTLGRGQSTISYWIKTGMIPAKWQPILLEKANERAINLSAHDFMAPLAKSDDEVEAESIATGLPRATHWGELAIGDASIPCYRLDNDQRVFSLKGVISGLMKAEHGNLAEYLKVRSLIGLLPADLIPKEDGSIPGLVRFDTGADNFAKFAIGLPVERFTDLCASYSSALQLHAAPASALKLTDKQIEIANTASGFLVACAKTGIIALVDEATGYQYERASDALRLKYRLFLEEEMRKWERTFPDQLWVEFGRLTKWTGPVHSRPKYWGKLIMELVYGYLDPDVAKWLKDNAPKPIHGQNYHQWLTAQYGLKRLVEHIWMLVGMAAACSSMPELRSRMAERFGRQPVQLTLYLPPPSST